MSPQRLGLLGVTIGKWVFLIKKKIREVGPRERSSGHWEHVVGHMWLLASSAFLRVLLEKEQA